MTLNQAQTLKIIKHVYLQYMRIQYFLVHCILYISDFSDFIFYITNISWVFKIWYCSRLNDQKYIKQLNWLHLTSYCLHANTSMIMNKLFNNIILTWVILNNDCCDTGMLLSMFVVCYSSFYFKWMIWILDILMWCMWVDSLYSQ